MPDVVIINDAASFASSTTSLAYAYPYPYNPTLRRRRTVQRLSRWVSKRISRHYLDDLDMDIPEPRPDDDDLYASYAAFCNAFTTSGAQQQQQQQKNVNRYSFLPADEYDVEAFQNYERAYYAYVNGNGEAGASDLGHDGSIYGHDDKREHEYEHDQPPSLSSGETQPSTEGKQPEPRNENEVETAFQSIMIMPELNDAHMHLPPLPPSSTSLTVSGFDMSIQDYANRQSTHSTHSTAIPPGILTPSLYAEKRLAAREGKRNRGRLWEPIRSLFWR